MPTIVFSGRSKRRISSSFVIGFDVGSWILGSERFSSPDSQIVISYKFKPDPSVSDEFGEILNLSRPTSTNSSKGWGSMRQSNV